MSLDRQITLSNTPLCGSLEAISSKSHAHRLLLAGALSRSKQPILIGCNTFGADLLATAQCLRAVGAQIDQMPQGFLIQSGVSLAHVTSPVVLPCNESGSTARFLLPVVAALGSMFAHGEIAFCLEGKGRLPQRPFDPICEVLGQNGCRINQTHLPITIGGVLKPGVFSLPGNSSSQYITGLLFALPLLAGDSEIRLTSPLESKGYVTLTLQVLEQAGVQVTQTTDEQGCERFQIGGGQAFCLQGQAQPDGTIFCPAEGDWSNSSFFLAAAALKKDSQVTLNGLLPPNKTAQGDSGIYEVLKVAGAQMHTADHCITATGKKLEPFCISLKEVPDLAPVLAVLAAGAQGQSKLCNGARLRLKESDRLETCKQLICDLGGKATIVGDDLIIDGTGTLKGGVVDSQNDHRIAMAAALGALICQTPVTLTNPGACAKSYPDFFAHWQRLQAPLAKSGNPS